MNLTKTENRIPRIGVLKRGFVRNQELQWIRRNAFCKDGVLIIECDTRKDESPLQKGATMEEIATVYRIYFLFVENGR
jgi:hypothetical protein